MFVYTTSPPASVSTSASANTDVDHLRLLTAATRSAFIRAVKLIGKGAAATALTGIQVWLKQFGTASTAGSGITPAPDDRSMPAAILTAFTGPTIGTTATILKTMGCGIAGPGGWQAAERDEELTLLANGGAAGNADLISQTEGVVALKFSYELVHGE